MTDERLSVQAAEGEHTNRELDIERDFEGLCLAYNDVMRSERKR